MTFQVNGTLENALLHTYAVSYILWGLAYGRDGTAKLQNADKSG
jgi:hypothetical protein